MCSICRCAVLTGFQQPAVSSFLSSFLIPNFHCSLCFDGRRLVFCSDRSFAIRCTIHTFLRPAANAFCVGGRLRSRRRALGALPTRPNWIRDRLAPECAVPVMCTAQPTNSNHNRHRRPPITGTPLQISLFNNNIS
ncbi:hypothetical protein Ddc_05002 [Ditylenchus destructor]|nr:hypothetical protein Ddc_05002 [Ditylenchus destructor]